MSVQLVDYIEKFKGPPVLGDSTLHFFEAMPLGMFGKARKHALRLPGLTILKESNSTRPGASYQWIMTFQFRDHTFAVDTNSHAALSEFFVADPNCPDEILLEVLHHFHKLSPLVIDPTGRRSETWKLLLLFLILTMVVLIFVIVVLEMNARALG